MRTKGAPRQVRAVEALDNGVLDALRQKFQVRLYRLDRGLSVVPDLKQLQATAPVTHIGDGLRQLSDETTDLPIGAVVLLSDGGENSGGLDREAISALRNRRIPVHTVGFGLEQSARDVEINDAAVAPRSLADSRLAATVNFHQRGYAGQKAMLRVREDNKVLAAREITLGGDGAVQTESISFSAGAAGAKALQFSIDVLDGEDNRFNNAVTRLVKVESDERRVLYVEGEPRWEFKFIRRAEDDDRIVKIVSMLRTTENKLYWQGWQGVETQQTMASGFPATAEALFKYHAIIIGSVEASYFTAGAAGPDQAVCGPARRRTADAGRRALRAHGGRLGGLVSGRDVSGDAADSQGDFPARTGHRGAYSGRRGQHDCSPGRGSGGKRGALEEAALHDELSGPRQGQAGRRDPAEHVRQQSQDAAADHAELRPRTNRCAGHRRHLALADEHAARKTSPTKRSGGSCCAGW